MGAPGISARLVTTVAGLLVAVLLFQALAFSAAGAASSDDTGAVVGRSAFAFIGGLRTFAAAVIWNRLDPIGHDYYDDQRLEEQVWELPAMRLVQLLDPQFTQTYYIASFVVYRRGDEAGGLEIAREGVRNNPKSGIMRANIAQLLVIDDPVAHRAELLGHVEAGLAEDAEWANADEAFEGVAIFRAVFNAIGDKANAQRMAEALERLRAAGAGAGDHDHDGDGEQDH